MIIHLTALPSINNNNKNIKKDIKIEAGTKQKLSNKSWKIEKQKSLYRAISKNGIDMISACFLF
ncbi:hypothetical protein KC375_06900 [Listeria monocytogenes]|nr:hypothetical protein [Listeria monocytogenes]EAE3687576.1 hypothetical protein [Listeria monocytogenes]EAE5301794.1 hypothetical protein [Listeria monocytogenes]EAE5968887.1 hypothetical protein [Listeria monocytogenes]EAE6078674.1 hypothetical protein [Listeria monocytogenes]EAH4192517.1 hypothetical protein [Listeria monocytogenes]